MIAVISEAPSGRAGPALVGVGYSGSRLARSCGLEPSEFERLFLRLNLFAEPTGGRWLPYTAWTRAHAIVYHDLGDSTEVVLLGRRVAAAFEVPPGTPWFAPLARARDRRERTWWTAPHPSGLSRWWNDQKNVRRAEKFWRAIARRAA